jgi:PPOX class probable F420-dependent enzyme
VREPTATAPRMPAGYGAPEDGSGAELLPWRWAEERLEAAHNYWVCTTRADGRPHAVPVWGLWLDGAFWFSTGRTSAKARNLARSPAVVVHLESGDDTVILEGNVEEATDALEEYAEAYEAKYGYRPDPLDETNVTYLLRPRTAQTWTERGFPRDATRWVFE